MPRKGESSREAAVNQSSAGGLARLLQGWKRMSFQNTSPTKEANHLPEGHRPRLHTTLRNPLDEGATATDARVEGLGANERLEFGEGPTRKGTATDYGCCESKRSGDRHPGGVPGGQGGAAVKWPWMQEARHPARSEHCPDVRRLIRSPRPFEAGRIFPNHQTPTPSPLNHRNYGN